MMLESKTFQTQNPGSKVMQQGLTQEQREIQNSYQEFAWLFKG